MLLSMILGEDLLDISDGKDGHQVYEEPPFHVSDCDDTPVLNHLEVFVVVSSVEYQYHIDEEAEVDEAIGYFPREWLIVVLAEGEAIRCDRASEDED
jgi:hypothetical protein